MNPDAQSSMKTSSGVRSHFGYVRKRFFACSRNMVDERGIILPSLVEPGATPFIVLFGLCHPPPQYKMTRRVLAFEWEMPYKKYVRRYSKFRKSYSGLNKFLWKRNNLGSSKYPFRSFKNSLYKARAYSRRRY